MTEQTPEIDLEYVDPDSIEVNFDSYTEPDDGLAEYGPEDFELDPEAADLPDLSDADYPPPPDQPQDDVPEGMGGIDPYVRPTKDALALVAQAIKMNRAVTVGMCLAYSRGWFNVGPYYLSAKDSLAGAIRMGAAHRVPFTPGGVKKIPRGVEVYWRGPNSQYGHIAPSFGAGSVGSTDWPTGRVGRVNAYVLAKAWGYTEIWWAPVVNDVRVWEPKDTADPTPLISRYLTSMNADAREKLLRRLAAEGDGDRPHDVKAAAQKILDGRDDRERAARIRARGERKSTLGRQALRGLEVDR